MGVQSKRVIGVTIQPEVDPKGLATLVKAGESFSNAINKPLKAINTIGEASKELGNSGKALVGALAAAGKSAGKTKEEISDMIQSLNKGLGNGKNQYFTTQTEAINKMAQAYGKYQKAVASGNESKAADEAKSLTRWANAYNGAQGGRLASTNEALVQGFGSADAVKEMAKLVRDVNSGKSKYGTISQDYSAKAFRDFITTMKNAEQDFRMNMKYLVGDDFLKTIGMRKGTPSDVQTSSARTADLLRGKAIDINQFRKPGTEKVSMDAIQYRVEELEGELDQIINEYLEGKAKSMDQAVDKVLGKGNRQKAMSDYEEYLRLTGNKARYMGEAGELDFESITPDKGGKTAKELRRHWQKSAYTNKYVKERNDAYAAELKRRGMDKIDLSMAPQNFELPEDLRGTFQEAYLLSRQMAQKALDDLVKQAQKEGKSLSEVLSQMNEDARQKLDKEYGIYLGTGGNEERYKTLGGDLPFQQYTSPQNRYNWKTKGLQTKKFQRSIQEDLDRKNAEQSQPHQQSLERQIARGDHFVKPKTSDTTEEEDAKYIESLVREELVKISKEVPKGKSGREELKNELESKLTAVFEAAKKANQQGREFSVHGAYGEGNDYQIRDDYYQWLALGGDRSKVSWGQVNPFEASYFNAIQKGGSTEDVRNRYRNYWGDKSPDAEQKRQRYDKQLEMFYFQRLADLQEQEESAEVEEQAREAQKQAAEERKSSAEKPQEEKKEEAVPAIPPREKRKKELQEYLRENAKNASKDNTELLDKYSEYKALGGMSTVFKDENGNNLFDVYSRAQQTQGFQKWKKQVATPEYAKSIGEETEAIKEENQQLERNNQLKQENASKTDETISAGQKATQSKKAELKSEQDIQAETAAIERRKKQLEDSLATANYERDLGLRSQGDLVGNKSNDYFEFKALGGDLSQLQKYGASKNYFEVMDQNLKKRMEDKWSSTVKSEEYLSALREENAALDENTSKVRENKAAKAESAKQTQEQSQKALQEKQNELKEDLNRMIEETRERANTGTGSLYKQYNNAQAESGYGGAIESEISQLEHLQDEQDAVIEKWNEFRALGGSARDLLGDDADEKDIEALNNLDDEGLIAHYEELHGLSEKAVEDKKKEADAQRELAAAEAESKAKTEPDTSTADTAQKNAEALEKEAEARKKANEAESESQRNSDSGDQKSVVAAEEAARNAEREAEAQKKAAEARKEAKKADDAIAGESSAMSGRQADGLASDIEGNVVSAINSKNKAFQNEQSVVTGVVEAEKAELSGLAQTISTEIPQAIDIKNASFMAEQDAVVSAVASEKSQINSLAQDIQSKVPTAIQEIGKAMTNQESTFSNSVTNINTTVNELCETLREIATAANEISGVNFDKLGQVVKPLEAYKVDTNASTNTYNFVEQVKKSTTDLSSYNKKTNVDTSAISDIGTVIKPFKVDKEAGKSLQEFITQIKEVKKTLSSIGHWDDSTVDKVAKVSDSMQKFKVGKSISTNLQNLIKPLQDLETALISLSSADIDTNSIQRIFSSLSNIKVQKTTGDKIKTLSDALKPLKTALEQFKGFDMSEMEKLTAFLAQASNLKDVSFVLKSSATNVKAARQRIDATNGTPTLQDQDFENKDKKDEPSTASMKKVDAIKQYIKSIQELLPLQQKIKSMESSGLSVPDNYRTRQKELKSLIDATKDYIDIEKQEVKQGQIKTNNDQISANILKEQVQKAKENAQQVKDVYAKINTDINTPGTEIGEFWNRFNNIGASGIEGIETKIDGLRQKLLSLFEAMKMDPSNSGNIAKDIQKLLKPYENASAVLTGFNKQEVQARIRQNLIAAAAQKGAVVQEGDVRFSGTKNMKGSVRITNKKGQTEILTQEFDSQTEALSRMNSMYATTKSSTDKFFDSLKSHGRSLATYLATFVSFYRVVDVFKDIIGQIKEFDTALTEMRKVSDESIDRLKNFQKESFNMAEQIGTTALQIQQSTADFMRLGQQLSKAKQSAANANILFNVSEFDNIDDATTSLIAMTQAYKDVSQTHIIDSLNKVGNDFSISTSGLAEALQRSASALTTSGNSLEESIGIITAANQVVQDPQSVGAAAKIISLRLAGQKQQIEDMGEDTEGMVTTVSKLRTGIMNATKVASNGMKGVDIEDANGNLKNTYSILQEIADIWEEIGDQDKLNGTNQQNYLLETMAGKNRSNVVASLLQSPDVLRDAYNEALDSEGSALVENQKQLESIEGHMNRIKNEASEFAYNFMSSDGLKGIIDLGTQFLKLLNDIGSTIGSLSTLGVIGGGIGTFRNLRNVYNDAVGAAAISKQVTGLQDAARSSVDGKALAQLVKNNIQFGGMSTQQLQSIVADPGITAAVRNAYNLQMGLSSIADAAQGAAKPVVKFGDVLHTALSGANLIPTLATISTLIISIGSSIYNAYQNWKQARIENAAELAGQFKNTIKDVDSQIESYDKLTQSLAQNNLSEQEQAKIKSQLLDLQKSLNETYGEQASNLDLVNGSYERQRDLLEGIKKQNAAKILGQAGATGQNPGDFKYAYDAMTKEYTTSGEMGFLEGFTNAFTGIPNMSDILDRDVEGTSQIVKWAEQFEELGLVIDDVAGNSVLTATGTAKDIQALLEAMSKDITNIPDYKDLQGTESYEILQRFVGDGLKHFNEIIAENEEAYQQYIMASMYNNPTSIGYKYNGKNITNDISGFYDHFRQVIADYNEALVSGDNQAIKKAKAEVDNMNSAWDKKLKDFHAAGDYSLDKYQEVFDGINDDIDNQSERAYALSQSYNAKKKTKFRKAADAITEGKISSTELLSAATGEGKQQYQKEANDVLSAALKEGIITDIKDSGQIEWLVDQMMQLGVFTEKAAKSANKATGTYASFLETVAKDDNSFSDMIDDLQSKSDSLESWGQKFSKGEVDSSGLVDLFQEFPDLASNAKFLQSVTDNMNADGFVGYTDEIRSALADLNFQSAINDIQKMNEELSDPDSYDEATRNAIRAQRDILVNSLDLSDVSAIALNKQIYSGNLQFKQGQQEQIKQLLRNTAFESENGAEIVARLLLDDRAATMSFDAWKNAIEQEEIEIQLTAPVKDFQKSIEATQNMVDKNSKLTSLEQSLDSGTAKASDLLSVIESYPAEFSAVSDVISQVLSGESIDGTISGAKELSDVFADIRVTNLEESLANASTEVERIIAYSQADLSGISKQAASRLISSGQNDYNIGDATKKDLENVIKSGSEMQRQAAVLAYGMQISFSEAMDIVEQKAQKTAVSAVKSFETLSNSVDSIREKIDSDSLTSDDVLGLVETFPDLLQYTDVLGQAFSSLSLSGVVTEASELEAVLSKIQQNKLTEALTENGIKDQSVVQALARDIDFSSISKSKRSNAIANIRERFGVDLSEYSPDIVGRVSFVVQNSEVSDIQQVVSDAVSQAANDGLKDAMRNRKNLESALSSLDSYAQKILSGKLQASDLDSIQGTFSDLITDGSELDALYSSLNMDGFVSDAQAASDLINNLRIEKLQQFLENMKDQDALSRASQKEMITQTRLTNVTKDQARTAWRSLAERAADNEFIDMDEINRLMSQGEYSAVIRMNLYPEVKNAEEFKGNVKSATEGYLKDVEASLNASIEIVSGIGENNSGLTTFIDSLSSGQATAEDLLTLLKDSPKLAKTAGSELSKLLDNRNTDGTLKNIEGIDETLSGMKWENLKKGIKDIEEMSDLGDVEKELLRKSAFATADLSGIGVLDAQNIVDTYARGNTQLENMAKSTNELEREAAAVAAGMGIDFAQAFQMVSRQAEQAKVSAAQSFSSMASSLSEVKDKIYNKELTSEDVLGLIDEFPDLLTQTDVLSDAFSQLSMSGVISDASTLEAILERIAQMELLKVLGDNGLTNQSIVQGLARSLSFDSTSQESAFAMMGNLSASGMDAESWKKLQGEYNKGNYDVVARVHFVAQNSEIEDWGKLVGDSVSQNMMQGTEKGINAVQTLSENMSTLDNASNALASNEFTVDDIASLEQSYGDLITDGELLNAVYSSINMDGLVTDAEAASKLINEIRKQKIQDFFTETESGLDRSSKMAILNSTRLTGITAQEGEEAYKAIKQRDEYKRNKQSQAMVDDLYKQGRFSALVRINMVPEYENDEQFQSDVSSHAQAALKDTEADLSSDMSVILNLQANSSKISDFATQVESGEATIDSLLSLIQEVPQFAMTSGDALAEMIDSANFDNTITGIGDLQAAMYAFNTKHLQEELDKVDEIATDNHLDDSLRDAIKGYLVDSMDLSGATESYLEKENIPEQIMQSFRKGEFSAEAIMKVFLKGQIDDADVMQKIEEEQGKIERSDLQATVNAQINLNSNLSSLNGLNESIISGEATTDDVLNLMNSMPDFLEQMQELGFVISDFDMDGIADNVDMIQTAIGKTKYKELTKFLDQNKNASQAQKMWNIMNTGLKGITAADHDLKNSALYDLVKGGGYSDEAVIKTDMMLDNGLISDNASSIQAMLNSLDTDVKIKTKLEDFQQTMTGLDSVTTAISEMNDTGNISAETIQAMKQAGIEYNDLLFETESGIKINTSAAEELTDSLANAGIAMADVTKNEYATQIRKNTSEMQKMVDEYNEAHGTAHTLAGVLMDVGKYGSEFADVFALDSVNQGLHSTIDTLSSLQGELRNSIDLFSKLQAAQSSANPSDNYNTITSAGETAKELWDQGWTGKDDFTSFAELIAPNWDQENETFDEWAENAVVNFEQNYEKVKKYLTEDASGLYTFLDDAEAQGFYKDTGNGMELVVDDLDAFADSLGISTSLAEQFMFALSDIGMNVEFDSVTDKFRQSVEGLNESLDNGEVIGNAGRQIQNAVDEFGYLSESGADARTALEPLIASMNKFHQMNPDQDIQPWIDQLNSYGLLDGFTISMNSDGSVQLTTTQLQQAKEVMDQINANSSIDVEAEVQTPDESAMANIEQLVNIANSSEAGRQALIDIGFKLPEGGQAITAEQIQQQIGEVKLKWSLESTPTSVPQDISTATHEQRKAMLSSGGASSSLEEQPQPVTIPVKFEDQQANSQMQSMRSEWEKPIEIEVKTKTTAEPTPANNAEGGSTPKPQKVENGGGSQIKVNVDSSEVDAAQQKVDQLQGTKIDSKKFAIIAQNLSWALNNTNRLAEIKIEDKNFSVNAEGNYSTATTQITSLVTAISQLHDKTVNITVNKSGSGSVGGPTSTALGTAHLTGTALSNAYAGGRDFTVGHKETAVVNELAPNRPESIIRDGKFSVIPGGPQLMNLRPDDIILNPDQTEDMLKSGKTARAGKLVSAHKTGSTNTTLNAFARGTATDLVGERGMEMYVDPKKNEWHTVGSSGPEMVNLPKDAIVFNAKQTEDLLTKGHTDTRGNVAFTNGSAEGFDVNDLIETPIDLLEGNAYLSGNAYAGNNNAQNVSGRATATKKMRDPRGNKSSESSSTNNNTDATDKNTKATKKNTEEKEKEGQVFDWVASRLSYLAEQTAKFADAITDFITYEDKLVNLVGKINDNGEIVAGKDSAGRQIGGELQALINEIAGNRAGAIRYQQEANSVKNPYANPNSDKERQANAKFAETKQMIDAGYKIDIETIKDDKLAKAIQDYQQYADAARQASNNVANLNRSLVELYDTWAKAPAEEAEKQIERLSKGINGLEAAEARLDAVSKGGSTHSILDSLLGRSTSGSYSNLGSAGYRAVAAENRLKTYNADQAFKQRTLELDRTLKNFRDFQAAQAKQTEDVVRSASSSHSESTSVSGGSTTRITKKQLKAQGRQIASEYGKKLTKKQKKSLKQGKRTTKINKISDNAAKAAVEAQNQRVQVYKIQTATIKQGKSIAKKYSKKLTKEQKKALKSGQQVDTSSVKNKKLKNKLTKYNSRIQKSNSLVTKTVTDTNTTGGVTDIVTAQDIVGNAQEGLQSFLDAINSAETDKITAAAELAAQKVQEIRDNFDYINDAYETQISYQESLNKINEQYISDAETFGNEITANMRDVQRANLSNLKMLKQREAKSLQKQLNAGVSSGTIKRDSKEWLEMTQQINEARAAAHDYSVEIKQLEIKKLEDITDHYSKLVDYMQSFADLNNVWNERDEIVGNYKKDSYYAKKITEQEAIRNKKQEEARKEQMQFQRMIGKRGSGATYEIGSDSYIAKQAEINKLWKEAYDAENDLAKLEAERIQFEIDNLNRVLEKQDTFIGNLNTMAGLINDAAKWNYDTGDLTQQGQLTMVVDKEAYNQALDEIQMVAIQKEKLLERLRNDASYGQQAYDDDIKELTSKQMSYLQTAKSALESFTKTVETTAQKQLEALNKVIDKRKEALAKEQEYYNYDKQLKQANRDVTLLEAQSRALQGVADAESKAMKARIDAQIAQKREAQQDTIRDHTVNLQTEGLSDLQNTMQENYERWSQEFEANSQQQLAVMQSTQMTSQQMSNTMNAMLASFGTNMAQMGMKISTVNTATTAAVTGMTGAFNAFTQDTTAYDLALRSNADKQLQEVAAWQGPISDTMTGKLAEQWTNLTSSGEATIIENMMLDSTGDTIVEDLGIIDESINGLPETLGELTDSELDALDASIGTITTDMAKQANVLASAQGDVASAVAKAQQAITTAIQFVIEAIGNSAATITNTYTTTQGESAASASSSSSKKCKKSKKNSKAKKKSGNKNKTKKKGSKGKAIGTMSINKDDIYRTQEKGGEIITTKDGVLIPLEAGDGVIPAQLTEKLFQMAREYPSAPNAANIELPTIQSSGTNSTVNVSYGSMLTVNGNVDREVLPDLKTILQESYSYTQKRLTTDALKGGMRRHR